MKPQIVITVSGGVVTGVWSNEEDADVTIYDWDNIADDLNQDADDVELEYTTKIQDLHEVA